MSTVIARMIFLTAVFNKSFIILLPTDLTDTVFECSLDVTNSFAKLSGNELFWIFHLLCKC